MPGYVEGKDKNEILNALDGTAEVGSRVGRVRFAPSAPALL
jgi:hypothetical protein